MATPTKRHELVMSALSKSDAKWNQRERKLELHLLELFEANRHKILDVFYEAFTNAIIKQGTYCVTAVEFTLEDFKEEDRAGLYISHETLADFGPFDMVNAIYGSMIRRECETIKHLLEQSGFICGRVNGGFSDKGPNDKTTYAYIWSMSAAN